MNQIKKRLSIIDLAISITDTETIELQVLKLKLLKIDLRVEEIINILQSRNYAQAQSLISKYIQSNEEKITPKAKEIIKPVLTDEDQAIIDEFQLFVAPTRRIRASLKQEEPIYIDDFAPIEKSIPIKKTTPIEEIDEPEVTAIDIDNLLNTPKIEVKKEPQKEPKVETIHKYKKVEEIDDNFFHIEETSKPIIREDIIPKDTFFDTKKNIDEVPKMIETKAIIHPENIYPQPPKLNHKLDDYEEEEKEIENLIPLQYQAIPHIGEKLLSMRKQYLSTDKSYENFATVEALLNQISQEGYTEKEIEETLFDVKKLVEEQRYSEAAQLLLVCAATESKFAHLMLARELYKGLLVNKNISESFLIINNLAIGNNAEALCDLGQFYENGIGVTKDEKKAQSLYEQSMELGIKRAKDHFKRLKKKNRSFFRRG